MANTSPPSLNNPYTLEKHTLSITILVWSQQMGATMSVAVLATWHSPPDTRTMEQLCQRNFVRHQKPLPSNSFAFDISQSLLHVHIKILCTVYNTMQWHVCMATVIRIENHVWTALWVLWVAVVYIHNIKSGHLKLLMDGLVTFQFQICDLTHSPREWYNYYISCYLGNTIVEERYEWHSDVLPR